MRRAAAVAALIAIAAAAHGAPRWRIDPDASVIGFVYSIDGAPTEGRFETVSGEGTFDPAAPGDSRLRLVIEVGSLELGDALAEALALSPGWFDAGGHPRAVYRLARLAPLGDGRWTALGDLTVKGRTVTLRAPVSLSISGPVARARGELAFDRLDVDVGGDLAELFVEIGRRVEVRFDIVARRLGEGTR